MESIFDVLEHLVRHARGYATIADRDAHLHVIAQARAEEGPAAADDAEAAG